MHFLDTQLYINSCKGFHCISALSRSSKMRAFIIVALLAFSHVQAAHFKSNRAFEETINSTLECVRAEMNEGWPDYGIPHFNPLQIEDVTVDFSLAGIEGLTGQLNIQDTTFAGLTHWVVTTLSGTIGLIPPSYTVNLVMNFPNPTLSTKYHIELQSQNLDYELFGTGTLDFVANNFAADVSLKATILGGIALEYLDLWVSMDDLSSFVITGVRDDEDYSAELSEKILNGGAALIEELSEPIHDIVQTIAMNLINDGGLGEEGGFLSDLLGRCLGG